MHFETFILFLFYLFTFLMQNWISNINKKKKKKEKKKKQLKFSRILGRSEKGKQLTFY